jgi:outer membrane protein OmpA-like peptidoglycan-associated protein
MGGLIGPYPDTDSASIGPIKLAKEWTHYTIDLSRKDLRHILGGFAFSLRRAQNPRGATFYLDEIMYEGANSPEDAAHSAVSIDDADKQKIPILKKPINATFPFPDAKTAFGPDGAKILDEFVGFALKFADATIAVDGHTDDIGPKATNQKLSLEHAKAVADYLVSKNVARERIYVQGYGGERPLHKGRNLTKQERVANRRVELTLVPKQ